MTHHQPKAQRIRKQQLLKLGPPALVVAWALSTPIVMGAEQVITFDIPPQALGSALGAYADAADVQLSYPAHLTTGLKSPGVSGQYTAQQALQKLLQGTGITPRTTANGTITLEKAATVGPQSSSTMPAVTVTGKNVFERYSPTNKEYAVPNAISATKTDTPIMETPVSVQMVSRSVMDDQQVVTVQEALKNVSGVQAAEAFYDGVIIRGFDTSGATFRNGLRQDAISGLETANLSQIEVLKGPSSVLYGRIQPGGMINLVTKRALDIPYFSVQQQFGSYDFYRTTVDVAGPLLEDKSLLGRMNIAYRSNNSFRDYVSQENILIAPTVTWRPNDKFEVNVDYEYQHYTFTDDEYALPAIGTRPANIPISTYLQDASLTNNNHPDVQDKNLVAMDWTYHFNDNWRVTNRFKYTAVDYHQTSVWPAYLDDTNTYVYRGLWNTPLHRDTYAANLDLLGSFDTGFLHHDTLIGFDFYRMNEKDGPGGPDIGVGSSHPDAIPPLNIYHPVYTGIDLTQLYPNTPNFAYMRNQNWYGLYFQDQITLWDKLHILGGGRQDWALQSSGESSNGEFGDIQLNKVSNNPFNPRVGVLYQPWDWLSIYGNYSESYGSANVARAFDGHVLSPETGQQGEVGVKTQFFDERLISTLAFYNLTKQNIPYTDPDHPKYSLALGEVRSRGIELDITGRLTDNLSVIGNYTYTDTKITKSSNGDQGNEFFGVPLNSGSLWTKYEFKDELLNGLSMGTGAFVRGERQGDNANTFQLPGYVRWDANVAYSFKQAGTKITTQFNVINLLDKVYYDRTGGWNMAIYPGQPLTFMGSVRVEY